MKPRFLLGLCAAGLSCLLWSGTAMATVTHTHVTVTSPSGRYLVDNEVRVGTSIPNGTQITVSGTSDGNGSDAVSIECYYGEKSRTLADGVAVKADGTFTYTGPLNAIDGAECVLRAVPEADAGTPYPPNVPSSFTGPTLNIGVNESVLDATAPNTDKLEDYGVYGQQLRGAFDYRSLGACGIFDGYVYDPVTFANSDLDYCDAAFWQANGNVAGRPDPLPGVVTATRSELQVGGVNAYLAGSAADFGDIFGFSAEAYSGFPRLSYSYSLDPTTHNLVIKETDQVVKCAPKADTYPPTSKSCAKFVPAGVQIKVRIDQGHEGRVASDVQSFSSTDGHSHKLDMREVNTFYHPNKDGEFDFPWTAAGMAPYTTAGQRIPGPPHKRPGSFFVKGSASVPDGDETAPQGAVTFATAPSLVTIQGTTDNVGHSSWVDLHYTRTVPEKGSFSLGFTYSNAFAFGEVKADATAAQRAFVPTVAITAPSSGRKVKSASVKVSGKVHDFFGAVSLKVNGKKVKVRLNGAWSTKVKLHKGANKITALATNVFGNTATSRITVSHKPRTRHRTH